MKIVFLGSAEFGIKALTRLMTSHEILAVVSTPPKPKGRGLSLHDSPIVEFARRSGISEIHTPTDLKAPDFATALARYNANLFVVVAFRILPRSIFAIPRLGTLNIHASLLPKFRGPAPIQRAIENGERETGVTVFRIDEGIDTGEILLQKKVAIGPDETTPSLYERLSELGAQALMEALEGMAAGTVSPLQQDSTVASGAPKLRKEEAHIDWHLPSDAIYNKIRAFKPFPGTYTLSEGKRLGIVWAEPVSNEEQGAVGSVVGIGPDCIDIRCGRGLLRVSEVKPEGRTAMKVRDFLQGHALCKGAVLS
jgi:methionyl-tRNA formyltransferase